MVAKESPLKQDMRNCQQNLMRDISELMDNLTAFFTHPNDRESGKTAIILSVSLFTNMRYLSNLIDEMQ